MSDVIGQIRELLTHPPMVATFGPVIEGMSMRDRFAAAVIGHLVSRMPAMPNDQLAHQAFALADALLLERRKGLVPEAKP